MPDVQHKFKSPPPAIKDDVLQLSFPAEHVLRVAMNRPKQYNAMNSVLEATLTEVFNWYESEPILYVAILGSTNKKAWCAGQDLKELNTRGSGKPTMRVDKARQGFGGISGRFTKKPIIGAINGYAMGGGAEMVMNLDMTIAGQSSTFGFPEVKRGITIAAGGLQLLTTQVGHQKAVEFCLTGRDISPEEAKSLGFVNEVVPDDQVESRALALARLIASYSPDSTRQLLQAIRLTLESSSPRQAFALSLETAEFAALWQGQNLREGLAAFAEKREPKWRPSKL